MRAAAATLVLDAVTCTEAEAEPPGSGLVTTTAMVVTFAAIVIVAFNSVDETNVAVTALPATCNCDVGRKPVPSRSRLKLVGDRPGVADPVITTGSGFRMDSVIEAEATGVAWVTAVIVVVFGFGIVAGGVYSPVVEIVPVELLPPATPFTCHVTAVLLVFVTIAVNWTLDPNRA